MRQPIRDIDLRAQEWDDVETLVPASNTLIIKNLRHSAFSRLVTGYLGDLDQETTHEWDGDDLKVVVLE